MKDHLNVFSSAMIRTPKHTDATIERLNEFLVHIISSFSRVAMAIPLPHQKNHQNLKQHPSSLLSKVLPLLQSSTTTMRSFYLMTFLKPTPSLKMKFNLLTTHHLQTTHCLQQKQSLDVPIASQNDHLSLVHQGLKGQFKILLMQQSG